MAHRIVILRHGESEWNDQNKFCGWVNVNLSSRGLERAVSAAKLLKVAGYKFDIAFTSALKRAQMTLEIILKELNQERIPVMKSWKLNERHYGDLTGMNRVAAVEKYGMEQVKIWRRSFDIPPPPIDEHNQYYREILDDECHEDIPSKSEFPKSESLKMAFERIIPFWEQNIVPEIKCNKNVLLVLHCSSSRAIVKHLSKISDEDIKDVNIPNGIPFEYYLKDDMEVAADGDLSFLGDPEEIRKEIQNVEDQLTKNYSVK